MREISNDTNVTLGELGDAFSRGFREGMYFASIRTAIVTSVIWLVFIISAVIAFSLLRQ